MAGLSLNTGMGATPQAASNATPSNVAHGASNISPPVQPQFQPQQYAQPQQQQQQQQQPPSQNAAPSSGNSSPVRPAYSPITPPLQPVEFPPPRPDYTHSSHPAQQPAIAPPRPEPIDFDSNPDVLALKNALAILQMQRKKAAADMVTLNRAKEAALQNPEAFLEDLGSNRIGVEGDRLFLSGGGAARRNPGTTAADGSDDEDEDDSDSDSDSSSDEDEAKVDADGDNEMGDGDAIASASDPTEQENKARSKKKQRQQKAQQQQPWSTLPKPQNVVRCPPVNWSQYAVVGESLDKLHNEQLARPTQGTPAVLTPEGRYEYPNGDGKQEPYLGIAAPYNPLRDRIDKKTSPSSGRKG